MRSILHLSLLLLIVIGTVVGALGVLLGALSPPSETWGENGWTYRVWFGSKNFFRMLGNHGRPPKVRNRSICNTARSCRASLTS